MVKNLKITSNNFFLPTQRSKIHFANKDLFFKISRSKTTKPRISSNQDNLTIALCNFSIKFLQIISLKNPATDFELKFSPKENYPCLRSPSTYMETEQKLTIPEENDKIHDISLNFVDPDTKLTTMKKDSFLLRPKNDRFLTQPHFLRASNYHQLISFLPLSQPLKSRRKYGISARK